MTLHRLILTSVGVGILAVAGVGCGGGGISLTDLPKELEDTVCKARVECGAFPDMETCRATLDFGNVDQAMASVDDGRANYDADKAQDCIDAIGDAVSCEPFTDFETGVDDNRSACNDVITGTVPVGGECWASDDCEGTGECDAQCGDAACCAGTCVAGTADLAPVAIGGDCSADGAECVAAGWCNDDGTNQTCVALGAEGAVCQGFSGCGVGLACDGFFGDGKCVKPAANGATCDPEQGFGLLSCARSDNWCDPADNTCKNKPVPGEACNVEDDNCIDYAYCNAGTCAAQPVAGEACVVDGDVDCMGDLECMNSVCVLPTPDPVCSPPAA